MENTLPTVKKELTGNNLDYLPAYFNVPRKITDIILDAKQNNVTLLGIRFLCILIGNIAEEQFRKKNKEQLSLFDDEWFLVDNDILYTVQLSFKFANFLPKGNKNYSQVKKGLKELRNLSYTLSYSIPDSKNKMRHFELESSLISSFLLEKNNGFKITIDKYWYRMFINLTEGNYNPIFKNIANIKSLNSILMYFFIKKLPYIKNSEYSFYKELNSNKPYEIERFKGTKKNLNDFLAIFNLSFNYKSQIIRDFLDPARLEMNNTLDYSFNYCFEKNNIIIVGYPVDKTLILNKFTAPKTSKIKNAISFKGKKYSLTKEQITMLVEIYLKYSYSLVLKATDKKKELRGLTGEVYFSTFCEVINKYVLYNKLNLSSYVTETPEEIHSLRKEIRSLLNL